MESTVVTLSTNQDNLEDILKDTTDASSKLFLLYTPGKRKKKFISFSFCSPSWQPF